jgi:hypothetical protein
MQIKYREGGRIVGSGWVATIQELFEADISHMNR